MKIEVHLKKESVQMLQALMMATQEADLEITSPIVEDVFTAFLDDQTGKALEKIENEKTKGYG